MPRTDPRQQSLELWPREHDLPPRWDGLPVEWGAWGDTAGVLICPPPKLPDRCTRCGSTEAALINVGRIWTDKRSAPTAIGRARLRAGKHLVGLITAFRCPTCEHDHVLDPAGQAWDLDDTDYGEDGSWDVSADR